MSGRQIRSEASRIPRIMTSIKRVFVTGCAGYVGAVLILWLLEHGYHVRVLERLVPGCDAVIHLACISNDPSFELNPELGKSINYDAFADLVAVAKDSGVRRFIYASSSSVYGVKADDNVTEDLPLEPLTDY